MELSQWELTSESIRFQLKESDKVAVVKMVLLLKSSRSISRKAEVKPPNPSDIEVDIMNPYASTTPSVVESVCRERLPLASV